MDENTNKPVDDDTTHRLALHLFSPTGDDIAPGVQKIVYELAITQANIDEAYDGSGAEISQQDLRTLYKTRSGDFGLGKVDLSQRTSATRKRFPSQ